jgi:hypothetical protein
MGKDGKDSATLRPHCAAKNREFAPSRCGSFENFGLGLPETGMGFAPELPGILTSQQ